MNTLNFKNFDDCIYNLPREIVKHPEDYLDYTVGVLGYIDNLRLTFDSYDCVTDVSLLGFKKNKITRTINDVLDEDRLSDFRAYLATSSQTCCMIDFETRNYSKGGNLISMTFSRHDKRMKWKLCSVYMRTVELSRDLPVYLVLLNRILSVLPNCSISEINIFVMQANISCYNVCGCADFYDIGIEETNAEHPFGRTLIGTQKNYFTDPSKLSKYISLRNMQELKFGLKTYKPIVVNTINLLGRQDDKDSENCCR